MPSPLISSAPRPEPVAPSARGAALRGPHATAARACGLRRGLAGLLLGAALLARAEAPAAPPAAAPPAPGLVHAVDEPRAYGHLVGDVLTRTVHLRVPPGLRLRADTLPVPGRQGQALELRAVEHQGPATAAAQTLTLRYQVFAAPLRPRVLELPPLSLAFEPLQGGRVQELRVDAWPVQVAPLGPAEAAQRAGLGDLQPDARAPALDTRAPRLRLGLAVAGLLLLLSGLAWVLLLRPRWQRRRRPFARLRRELAAWPASALEGDARPAFARVHAALRAQAGRNLLAPDLPAYLAARPGLAPMAGELHAFHQASAALFFQPAAGPATGWDLARLRRLAVALAEVERLAPDSIAVAQEGA